MASQRTKKNGEGFYHSHVDYTINGKTSSLKVINELKKYNIKITALQEVTWKGHRMVASGNRIECYSVGTQGRAGTGFA